VFDSRLVVEKVPIERGDRLVIVNSARRDRTTKRRGAREKTLYGHVLRTARSAAEFSNACARPRSLRRRRRAPRDVSIVTISRA